MRDLIGDCFDRQLLCVADRFLACCAVGHDAGQFKGFGDPATVGLAVEFNRHDHFSRYTTSPYFTAIAASSARSRPARISSKVRCTSTSGFSTFTSPSALSPRYFVVYCTINRENGSVSVFISP